ncbi:glycosyltransferase [Halorhodospira sp. 9621]|nr:glycosyltransferase [Halorhodospira sp. 9621]
MSSGPRRLIGWIESRFGALTHRITDFQPSLIVLRPSPLCFNVLLLLRRINCPYVLKTAGHGTAWPPKNTRPPLSQALRSVDKQIKHSIYRNASVIDTVSTPQRDSIIENHSLPPEKVIVLDNGVDVSLFTPEARRSARHSLGLSEEDRVIGYVGNYPMSRGGKEIIDVLAELRNLHGIKGVIVGDGGEATKCQDYADSKGVSDDVKILGAQPFDRMPEMIPALDIGFSIKKGREQESSELKVRQYLACGCLVVGSKGSNDFLRDKPFARVLSENETKTITKATQDFLRLERQNFLELQTAARQFAENNLSVYSRNNTRLNIWKKFLS